MKAVTTAKTYEYQYKAWTQPVFTANQMTVNGIWYSLTASRQANPAWYAFDGDTTTNQRCWWDGKINLTNDNPDWVCLQCSEKLKLTSVDIMNEKYQPENPKFGAVQASNDGINWTEIGSFNGTNSASYVTKVPLAVDRGYLYYRCYFTENWADGVSLQEITFHGQIATKVEYKNTEKSKYKKISSYENWTQPVFTSNVASDGSMITCGSTDSQYGNHPYKAMDNDTTTQWGAYSESSWWKVKFPYHLAITKLEHVNRNDATYCPITGRYYADEQMKKPIGSQFTNETPVGSTIIYNSTTPVITDTIYFKKVSGNKFSGIGELKITAKKIVWKEGTAQDYDIIQEPDIETVTNTVINVVKKGVTHQYQYGSNHVTKVGSPTVNKNLASGFTVDNYLQIPYAFNSNIGSSTWEIGGKFKINSKAYNPIYGGPSGTFLQDIYVDTNNKFCISLSSNGSKYNIAESVTGSHTVQLNKDYWVKLAFTGSAYILSYSLDGITYTQDINVSSTTVLEKTSDLLCLGFRAGNYLRGTIDLSGCYLKIGNGIRWYGIDQNKLNSGTHDFTKQVTSCFVIKGD